ncbi:MAG TPA: hypothetical protein VID26_01345 [Candidatus Limnocylindrales bacterium]|jgi:hypothetical protein
MTGGYWGSAVEEENVEADDWWFERWAATAPDDAHEPPPMDHEAFVAMWQRAWPEKRPWYRRLLRLKLAEQQ